jgi:hypothetical protein
MSTGCVFVRQTARRLRPFGPDGLWVVEVLANRKAYSCARVGRSLTLSGWQFSRSQTISERATSREVRRPR